MNTSLPLPEPYDRRFVTSPDGTRIAVQQWGNPEGVPFLLLHAFGMGQWAWRWQVGSYLAEQYRFVTLDHRGHGESDRPVSAEHYADGMLFAADIATVIRELRLERPGVVAWSMSGALLGDYLAAHGDTNLSAIALIGAAHALGEPLMTTGQLGSIFANPLAMAIHDPVQEEAGFAHINRGLLTNPIEPGLWEQIQASSLRLPIAARGAILMRPVDHLATYRATQVPLLTIHAENDPIVSIAATERLLTARPEAESLYLPGAAHAPHWEHAAGVNAALASFFASASVPYVK
jgi:non-heme chloroperoxidase